MVAERAAAGVVAALESAAVKVEAAVVEAAERVAAVVVVRAMVPQAAGPARLAIHPEADAGMLLHQNSI